jgi:hypothetical protein
MRSALAGLLLLIFVFSSRAQVDSSKVFRKRKTIVGITAGSLFTGSLIGLNELWYKDFPRSKFHSFNDNSEWLQMDKVGHTYSTYQMGRGAIELMRWSGFTKQQRAWIGGMSGSIYMTGIEILDAYSSEWGFSSGDMIANVSGSLIATSQELLWEEQRIQLKYSFHRTDYPLYRPNILGKGLQEEFLKDYNGQSYWLSLNISSFLKKETPFPKWLSIAVGYGAEGMISGRPNYYIVEPDGKVIGDKRYRKYLISLDVDLSRIKTKSKLLNTVLKTINILKVPAPAMELSERGVRGYWIYF